MDICAKKKQLINYQLNKKKVFHMSSILLKKLNLNVLVHSYFPLNGHRSELEKNCTYVDGSTFI